MPVTSALRRTYCAVCNRETTAEIPPLHLHMSQAYDAKLDCFWFGVRLDVDHLHDWLEESAEKHGYQVFFHYEPAIMEHLGEQRQFAELFHQVRQIVGLGAWSPGDAITGADVLREALRRLQEKAA